MNALRNHRTGKWAVVFALFSLLAAVSAEAIPTATVTVQVVGGGTVTPNYNGQTLTLGNQYSLTAKPKAGFVFTGWTGDLVSSQPKLTFVLSNDLALAANFVDTQIPTLSIWPVSKSWATNSVGNAVYLVTGKAKDNGAIAQVYCKVNGGAWQPANTGNNWSNWWCNVTLQPGDNIIYAYALDGGTNASKTSQLKVTYSAAQPNLFYPYRLTMLVTNAGNLVEVATFSTNTFSDETGIGTYTYKKTGPVTAKLAMKYTAPPSAMNATNNVNVTMQYDTFYSGSFTDVDGLNSFILIGTENASPLTLDGSTLTFTDNNGTDQTVITFPNPPQIAGSGDAYGVSNPLTIALNSAYSGQIGDRVKVTFNHRRPNSVGVWVPDGTRSYTGTAIDIGTNNVTILFDNSGFVSSANRFAVANGPLDILSYYFTTYSGVNLVTNGTGTFTYNNYTSAGSLLQLSQAGQSKSVILTFTNDSAGGIYYDETHLPDNTYTTDAGSFQLALPPQITTQPQSFAWTNGGNASFTVVVSGTPVLVYQWQFKGTNLTDGPTGNGSTISGSTNATLTIAHVSNSDLGNYQVIITNNYGSVTSSLASLTLAAPPQITLQPFDAAVFSGQTVNLNVSATGSAPLGYRWQGNGTNLINGPTPWSSFIQGATTANLSISAASTNDTGIYRVIITNSFGSVTSSVVNVNVF